MSTKTKTDPTLLAMLGAFPGGLERLALVSGLHRSTLYMFARGDRPEKFSYRIAGAVRAAFHQEATRVRGRAVTVDRIEEAWMRARLVMAQKKRKCS